MKIPSIKSVRTANQARDFAIDWQLWQSEQSMSYGEAGDWQAFFEQVVEKFPDLRDEFEDNAII